MEINQIKPSDIAKYITFIQDNKNWQYDETKRVMESYQAEGVAGLINRLEKYKIALLSDEVGMGKTYQALGVVFYYKFNHYKDKKLKVLIISPRKEVMTQWGKEYEAFKKNHLKKESIEFKTENLKNFTSDISSKKFKNRNTIVFAHTNSFSTKLNQKEANQLIDRFRDFDLFIIDEAHKYRQSVQNEKERTLRTKNAKKFFSSLSKEKKILLLTATPLHSTKDDLTHVVNVFKQKIYPEIENDTQTLMKNLMIRRLRVLDKYNKYHYREEKEIAVDIKSKENNYQDEFFYAMLQKEFINDDNENKDLNKSKNLVDLLEGTVFDQQYLDKEMKDNINKTVQNVLNKFQEVYGKNNFPSNQKYNEVLNTITQSDEKALVFVKRRASAIELARQFIEVFDKKWWKYLTGNENYPIKQEKFEEELGFNITQSKLDEFIDKREYIKDKIKTKKERRKRVIEFYRQYNKINKINFDKFYEDIIKDENYEDEYIEENIKINLPKSVVLSYFQPQKKGVITSAQRFVRKFNNNEGYKTFFEDKLLILLIKNLDKLNKRYEKDLSKEELEKKYTDNLQTIKSAIIHASIGIIELFKCEKEGGFKYGKIGKEGFIHHVNKEFIEFEFVKQIYEFIRYFDNYAKAMDLNKAAKDETKKEKYSNQKLAIKDEDKFKNAQPAYAYLSNSNNENVLARFNSPFFPNLLCGTSTLEEGLNLHVHCNKIYHFSAAYTMGSDEQRIGRVDRLHGKMHRELEKDKTKKLNIHYPYLKSTFDEENLRSMLCKKRYTEKDIDVCKQAANFDKQKDIQVVCNKEISRLLHNSNENSKYDAEPYGWEMLDD